MIAITMSEPPSLAVSPRPRIPWAKIVGNISDMTCSVCPITVKKSLEKVSGVSAVKVDFAKKTAVVTSDRKRPSRKP